MIAPGLVSVCLYKLAQLGESESEPQPMATKLSAGWAAQAFIA